MTMSQLKGQIFNREGTNYLVVEDNDWSSETLNVRAVNNSRQIHQMPRSEVVRCVEKKAGLAYS